MLDFFKQGNPDGLFSWQHLVVCAIALSVMIFLGVFLGIRGYRKNVTLKRNKVLIWAACLIWVGEFSKFVVVVITSGWSGLLDVLPLFLCSLQLITLPLVCLTKGKFQQAMADIILVFGIVGALTGTLLATEFTYNAAFSFSL